MRHEQLVRIAAHIKHHNGPAPLLFRRPEETFVMNYHGKVVGKERPREAGGHFYTPTETRNYELAVRKQAKVIMLENKIPVYRSSVTVHIRFYDPLPDDWPDWQIRLAQSDMINSWEGADLDNKEKAILDALNGIVYEDDRQVIQSFKVRHYHKDGPGFGLSVSPCGLTKNDLDNIRKLMAVK